MSAAPTEVELEVRAAAHRDTTAPECCGHTSGNLLSLTVAWVLRDEVKVSVSPVTFCHGELSCRPPLTQNRAGSQR